ncbi:MAG: hypothetical protein DI570_08850 [Phenylobacterium zucineum]|nr:MAG: hypothetical protein DI570_08850 [Phenylobacterium zucineum]
MARARSEPFEIALATLRRRLREGTLRAGLRITAVDVADDLKLSTTPVREVLSRLAGEGLLEDRRGQGFFVRQLGAGDIESLYRTSLALLLVAEAPRRAPVSAAGGEEDDSGEAGPVAEIERLFAGWVAEAGSRSLTRNFRVVQYQLGVVRRLEPVVLGDLRAEADALAGLSGPDLRTLRLSALRQFHGRRIQAAETLARELEASSARAKL